MAKNVNTQSEPVIEEKPEVPYLGIRIQTPFEGMFKQVGIIQKELERWFKAQGITPNGSPLLRYHVIDMKGEMDIEYGIPVEASLTSRADGRVTASVLPAGRYASLIYTGSGLQGNGALSRWIQINHIPSDRWDTDQGDNFRCRYEMFLTDPKVEPRKTKWDIEVAIKLLDE